MALALAAALATDMAVKSDVANEVAQTEQHSITRKQSELLKSTIASRPVRRRISPLHNGGAARVWTLCKANIRNQAWEVA